MIAGGGLAALLTAWRCLETGTAETVTILEAADHLAGDHTWSFNLTDLSKDAQNWIQPFIAHQWPRYDVRFPKLTRTLDIAYATGTSASLRGAVAPLIAQGKLHVLTGQRAKTLSAQSVTTEAGETYRAGAVLDARGQKPSSHMLLGYQKFVGQILHTKAPHGLAHPIIMDATVDQMGGYRFVYCLPFSQNRLLVEDTYYTDGADLEEAKIIARIGAYAAAQGWEIKEIERTERGILPITLASDIDAALAAEKNSATRIGLAAGLFNATTGYSLPDAVRLAEKISGLARITPQELHATITECRYHHWEREKFYRLLNRMLFKAAKPEERYKVLQRFYHLDQGLIARFYEGSLTKADKLRILSGKPPVPVGAALYNYSESRFMARHRSST